MTSWRKELIFRIDPTRLLVITAVVIFLVEVAVMLILQGLPPLSPGIEAIIDSTILLMLLSPFYLGIYRPFWEERQKQARQIRFLSRQLLSATEEESKRIAHEIHDQCGQTLTALQFGLQTLKKQIGGQDPQATQRVTTLEQLTAQLSGDLRSLTSRLRPAILDEAGLLSALTWLCQDFRRNFSQQVELACVFPAEEVFPRNLAAKTENAVYRIYQEALTNIARHAGARRARLELQCAENRLRLTVEDNGQGFDLAACLEQRHGQCGVGLLGMQERARMVGGELEIVTSPGAGTKILADIPLKPEETR